EARLRLASDHKTASSQSACQASGAAARASGCSRQSLRSDTRDRKWSLRSDERSRDVVRGWKCSTNDRTRPILRACDMRSSESTDEGGVHTDDTDATRTIRAKKNFSCQVLNRICTERPQVFHILGVW